MSKLNRLENELQEQVEREVAGSNYYYYSDRRSSNMSSSNSVSVRGGIGLGTLIAVIASWSVNQSVGWAILHGIFGWFYVIYHLFKY